MAVLVTIAAKIWFCEPVGPALKITTLDNPGAMAIAMSMSKVTSLSPLLAPVVGVVVPLSNRISCRVTGAIWAAFS